MGDFPFEITIMKDLMEDNQYNPLCPRNMQSFLFLDDTNKTMAYEAYKQVVLSNMLVMGCTINKDRLNLEEHMKISTGDNNPYSTKLAQASAQILSYETAEQKQAQKWGKQHNDDDSDSIDQEEGHVNFMVNKSPNGNIDNDINN